MALLPNSFMPSGFQFSPEQQAAMAAQQAKNAKVVSDQAAAAEAGRLAGIARTNTLSGFAPTAPGHPTASFGPGVTVPAARNESPETPFSTPAIGGNLDWREYANPNYTSPPDQSNYQRFDLDSPGAGTQNMEFMLFGIDKMLSSRGMKPVDLSGLDIDAATMASLERLAMGNGGSIGDILGTRMQENLNPETLAAIKYNAELKKWQSADKTFFTPEVVGWYNQAGIDIQNINSAQDIQGLDQQRLNDVSLAVLSATESAKQFENQKEKAGLLDSIPGQAILGLSGLFNPLIPAVLGATVGGVQGGNFLDAVRGGIQGYNIGNFTNSFTTNGLPPGIDPRDIINTPDQTPGGRDIPVFSRGGGGNPTAPPTTTGGNPGGGGGGDLDVPGGTARSPTNTPSPTTPGGTPERPKIDPRFLGILGTLPGILNTGTNTTTNTSTTAGNDPRAPAPNPPSDYRGLDPRAPAPNPPSDFRTQGTEGTGTDGTGNGDGGDGDGTGTPEIDLPTLPGLAGGAGNNFGQLPHNAGPRFGPSTATFQERRRTHPEASAGRMLSTLYPALAKAFDL